MHTDRPDTSEDMDQFIPGAYPGDSELRRRNVPGTTSELPSKEVPSGSDVGVGSLPGQFNEPGVATLPEERIDGRPYGSGHTGFEETLGNRTTHVPNMNPSNIKGPPGKKIDPEEQGRARTAELSSQIADQPGPTASAVRTVAGKAGSALPGLAHTTGEVLSSAAHAGGSVLGSMESAAAGAIPKFQGEAGSVLTNAVHAGENVVGTVERAAVDAMHGAETMLAGVGETAKSYMPNMPTVGAYFGGAGPDKATTASEDSLLDQRSNNPKVKRPYRPRPALVSSNSSGSFVTSGLDAPNSRSRSRLDLAHSDVSSTQLASGMATPSSVSSDMTGSSQPYKLPNVIKREYAKSVEFDMYGDEVKTEDFLYENDFSSSDTEGGVHHPHGPHHHHHHHQHGLRHPHVHAEEPVADIPSTQRSGRKEVDLVTGVDGVTFHRTGQNGKLPGYPTEEGMKRLISDCIKADNMREAQDGKSPASDLRVTDFGKMTISEGPDLSTNDQSDSELSDRQVKEMDEVPVFVDGQPTATGKFEAVMHPVHESPKMTSSSQPSSQVPIRQGPMEPIFVREDPANSTMPDQYDFELSGRHVDEMPEVPEFIGGQPTAMGKYEAVLHPVSSAQPRGLGAQSITTKNPTEGVKMGPGYLGKPVDQEEFSSNIEQARRDIDRKLGVN